MTEVDPRASGARFAEILCQLDSELDWTRLGRVYCHEGGDEFFSEDSIRELRDSGLRIASDLVEALEELGPARGPSAYVGVGVFELAPIVAESVLLRREVELFALPGEEAEELNRVLAIVETRTGHALPRLRTERFDPPRDKHYAHAWLVSVLTDPDHFPALHDELYERKGTPLATSRGNLAEDRRRARSLVQRLLSSLTPRALFTTSDEELTFITAVCRSERLHLDIPDHARLSGIVGDPVRLCRITRHDPPSSPT